MTVSAAFNKKFMRVIYVLLGVFILRLCLVNMVPEGDQNFEGRLQGPLSDDNERLIRYVKQKLLPPATEQYKLELDRSSTASYSQYRKGYAWLFLYNHLFAFYGKGTVKNGFFVEAGALDGEYTSNTLFLEKDLGWTGLLVEPDEEMYRILRTKNRRVWSCHCCLAGKKFPYQTVLSKISRSGPTDKHRFAIDRAFSSLVETRLNGERLSYGYAHLETVQCFPLQTILAALNKTHVDVVSLDIEDAEWEVLSAFPFDRITVDVWLVEHRHHENQFVLQVDKLDQEFVNLFQRNGYTLYSISPYSTKDYVFVRTASSLYKELPAVKKS